MSEGTPKDPQHAGRRAHPHGHDVAPGDAPRRALVEPDDSPPIARRASFEEDGEQPVVGQQWWRRRSWWVVAVAMVALLGLVLSLVYRASDDTPAPTVAVPINSSAGPTSSPGMSTSPPSSDPPDVSSSPSAPTTTDAAPPLPGAASSPSVPDGSQPAEPEPTATIAAGDVQLNDARFSAPQGWSLYGDEEIEGSRRVVRLSQQDTDVRMQAVTLEPSGEGLGSACSSLVDFQQAQFADVEKQLVAPIGVDAKLGSAVQCGFSGIRASDGVDNAVTFTIISRASDSHVLMLRTTVPKDSSDASPIIAQLNAMACGASTSFGVSLPLC